MEWYYAAENEQQVLFNETEFPQLIADGRITTATLVWNQNMTDWQAAGQVKPELFNPAQPVAQAAQASPYLAPQAAQPHRTQVAGPPQQDESHGLQLASMICGILSITCLGALTGIPAIICGHLGRSKKRQLTGSTDGSGMALAGLIMGYASIALTFIAVVVQVLAEL